MQHITSTVARRCKSHSLDDTGRTLSNPFDPFRTNSCLSSYGIFQFHFRSYEFMSVALRQYGESNGKNLRSRNLSPLLFVVAAAAAAASDFNMHCHVINSME